MSLRDQLLKAGIVDKKKVARANRDLKKNRREGGAGRESKRARQAREAAARAQAHAEQEARRRKEADDRIVAEQGMARRRVVRSLLRDHALPHRSGQPSHPSRSHSRPAAARANVGHHRMFANSWAGYPWGHRGPLRASTPVPPAPQPFRPRP